VQGISTRSVDDLVKALGMSGVSKSQVSRLCGELDERVGAFLNRQIEGDWPYLWCRQPSEQCSCRTLPTRPELNGDPLLISCEASSPSSVR
jgi:Transposase, Mutator family